MDNLLSLTLPSFDIHILRLHSASALHIDSMDRPTLSPSVSRSWSMTTMTGHQLDHFLQHRTLSIPRGSAIAAPSYSNAGSGRLHAYYLYSHTLLPNLTSLYGPPHLVILLAPSGPLIDASITISSPIYARLCPTMTLETLPSSVRRLRFNFEFARECTKEKTLRSDVLVCPFEELKVEGRSGEEC
ncbi:hypothetical protein ARMGADRAFT_1171932 [Armillaria gallica]|uniref:Uncharacterized protein n=1 Tax=Armillaria gallica TaxID=47427 RepID=A0A2H3CBC2_ARMGA|nr:hypothetical protein ARMGADRAFT_1171932 [Armillaria gallica]